jgi:hypothetical protein
MAREKDYLCGLSGNVDPDMIRVYKNMLEKNEIDKKSMTGNFIINHYYTIVLILLIIIVVSIIMNFEYIVNIFFVLVVSLKVLAISIGLLFE